MRYARSCMCGADRIRNGLFPVGIPQTLTLLVTFSVLPYLYDAAADFEYGYSYRTIYFKRTTSKLVATALPN